VPLILKIVEVVDDAFDNRLTSTVVEPLQYGSVLSLRGEELLDMYTYLLYRW
jgi:hypothetical protein